MKKYFMFATVAIATLFASCSSDDFVAPKVASEDVPVEEGLVPIQIGVGSHIDVSTRGTGTVGSVGADGKQNFWYGQKINVFMTQKDANNQTTMTLASNNGEALYENALMVTPGTGNIVPTNDIPTYDVPQASGQAMLVDGSIKYYPINGNFDFFGYHGDGATAVPALNQAEDAFEATFTIDGSQDLMAAKAKLNEAQTGIMNAEGDANKNRYYSAYAARRKVQPILEFDHLLTRLQFNIKAGNKETAGVEDGYLKNDDQTFTSKTTYDNLPTKADYTLFNYVLISDGTTTVSTTIYDGYTPEQQANYAPQYTADAGQTVISKDVFDGLYDDADAKAAAYTPGTRQVDPSDPNYTGVKVKAIEIYSKTKGTLLTAWTAADPQRLTWDEADATTTGWLSLQQHTGEILGYIKNDRSDYVASADWATAPLTEQEKTLYAPFYNPNTDLVALTQVAPGYYADGADNAEKFYYKQVGEALLVSLPVSSENFADVDDYEMKVTLTQRVKTNWDGTISDYTIDPIPVTIPKPEGGFKANTSYNVNLTLYGVERIDVYTTITPWEAGAPIDLEIE